MSKPLFYKSPPNGSFLVALSLAAGIELAAVAFASRDGIEEIPWKRNYCRCDETNSFLPALFRANFRTSARRLSPVLCGEFSLTQRRETVYTVRVPIKTEPAICRYVSAKVLSSARRHEGIETSG